MNFSVSLSEWFISERLFLHAGLSKAVVYSHLSQTGTRFSHFKLHKCVWVSSAALAFTFVTPWKLFRRLGASHWNACVCVSTQVYFSLLNTLSHFRLLVLKAHPSKLFRCWWCSSAHYWSVKINHQRTQTRAYCISSHMNHVLICFLHLCLPSLYVDFLWQTFRDSFNCQVVILADHSSYFSL